MPERTRSPGRITRRMRKSRDWYVVLYQLAAQRTNVAMSEVRPDRRLLAKADDECARLVRAAAKTAHQRRRHRFFLDDTGLIAFVDEVVLPTACVLWAGIMVARKDELSRRETVTYKSLLKGERPAPLDLVRFATRPEAPYRVHYNLACFHTSLGNLDGAEAHLHRALDSVFGTTQAYIATKALHDSSLSTLVSRPALASYLRAVTAQTRLDERG